MAKPSTGWNTSPTTSTAVDDNNERRGSSGALVFSGTINPGKVFDLVLPLDQVAEGYRAMDERRAIKTLLRPSGN